MAQYKFDEMDLYICRRGKSSIPRHVSLGRETQTCPVVLHDFHGAAAKRIGAGVAGWSGRAATSARTRPCTRTKGTGCLCGFALPELAQPRALG